MRAAELRTNEIERVVCVMPHAVCFINGFFLEIFLYDILLSYIYIYIKLTPAN